eukprot:CAMPEP_0198304816 /NCGR_PEP_ID=MMETSP1449-20131203/57594_1 /TAXON_ID=420275 /ORGANISM="Attheya septentrionalis, Strain CCMP2084" /LENGTH=947 /DNA_ID=CAMNT_0044007345 /DNA_START=185 /DNA_END=3028 /DNA_ORIENTATION=+
MNGEEINQQPGGRGSSQKFIVENMNGSHDVPAGSAKMARSNNSLTADSSVGSPKSAQHTQPDETFSRGQARQESGLTPSDATAGLAERSAHQTQPERNDTLNDGQRVGAQHELNKPIMDSLDNSDLSKKPNLAPKEIKEVVDMSSNSVQSGKSNQIAMKKGRFRVFVDASVATNGERSISSAPPPALDPIPQGSKPIGEVTVDVASVPLDSASAPDISKVNQDSPTGPVPANIVISQFPPAMSLAPPTFDVASVQSNATQIQSIEPSAPPSNGAQTIKVTPKKKGKKKGRFVLTSADGNNRSIRSLPVVQHPKASSDVNGPVPKGSSMKKRIPKQSPTQAAVGTQPYKPQISNASSSPPGAGGSQDSRIPQNQSLTSLMDSPSASPAFVPAAPNGMIPTPPPGISRVASAPFASIPVDRVHKTLDGKGGLGKVLYFLDQMKLEVTDADRTIKELQSGMKFLREKNKELEARNRESEKRCVEEKTAREASEAKVKSLRSKLKEMKERTLSLSPHIHRQNIEEEVMNVIEPLVQSLEDVGSGRTEKVKKGWASNGSSRETSPFRRHLEAPHNKGPGPTSGSGAQIPLPPQKGGQVKKPNAIKRVNDSSALAETQGKTDAPKDLVEQPFKGNMGNRVRQNSDPNIFRNVMPAAKGHQRSLSTATGNGNLSPPTQKGASVDSGFDNSKGHSPDLQIDNTYMSNLLPSANAMTKSLSRRSVSSTVTAGSAYSLQGESFDPLHSSNGSVQAETLPPSNGPGTLHSSSMHNLESLWPPSGTSTGTNFDPLAPQRADMDSPLTSQASSPAKQTQGAGLIGKDFDPLSMPELHESSFPATPQIGNGYGSQNNHVGTGSLIPPFQMQNNLSHPQANTQQPTMMMANGQQQHINQMPSQSHGVQGTQQQMTEQNQYQPEHGRQKDDPFTALASRRGATIPQNVNAHQPMVGNWQGNGT